MHCKLLKLTNGEDIIVMTDDSCTSLNDKEYISVIDAVLLNIIKYKTGAFMVESFVMEPWIRIAKEDVINIPTKSIVVAADIKDDAIQYYQKFIIDQKNKSSTIRDMPSMEEMLEHEFSETLELQEEESDEPEFNKQSRILH